MQSIIKRSSRAKAQFQRKLEQSRDRARVYDSKKTDNARKRAVGQRRTAAVNAYRNAIEDYKLGPLAPKRNIGPQAIEYGGLQREAFVAPKLTNHKAEMAKYVPFYKDNSVMRNRFRPDDRVVIIRGQERGMIGRIQSVDEDSQTLRLADLHKVYSLVSETDRQWLGQTDVEAGGQLQPMYLPQKNVRLVITSPKDGQDIIVDKMIVHLENHEGKQIMRRRIPGTLEDIDVGKELAKEEEENQNDGEYGVRDTFTIDMEKYTWTATLDQPPFPAKIIDELRSKYSKFRTRHDEAFVEKLVALDEKAELKTTAAKIMLRTPGKEFAIQQRSAARKVAANQSISSDSMSLLGEFMAKNLKATQQAKLLKSLPRDA